MPPCGTDVANSAAVTLMTVKITEVEQTEGTKLFVVEGKLTNGDAEMLGQKIERVANAKTIALDLSGVTFIDSDGASVLQEMERKGVKLTGADFFIKTIIDAHDESLGYRGVEYIKATYDALKGKSAKFAAK